MYRVAVIGAGQLGSRHLQGLSQVSPACEIFVVDPSTTSLDVARKRFAEVATVRSENKMISYHTSMEELPTTLDYVVVATNADIRLNVMRALLAKRRVGSLLLEKVLFQYIEDYQAAEKMLFEKNVQVWVNCPRRIWAIYRMIHDFFAGDTLRYFQVRGGAWGLGCNSVHYLDLLAWLTKSAPSNFTAAGLDKKIINSKRLGFFEFTGTLQGDCGDALFEITSLVNSNLPSLLTIRSDFKTCIIDEGSKRAYFLEHSNGRSYSIENFDIPPISSLSTEIAEQILLQNKSGLPSYQESKAYHLPFIASLGEFAAKSVGTPPNFCKIT
ncbi:Gfo/Idh/MocA family oxidoreductase [Vogesella amnigena]|uniref:Gfo/Idh/MocA family oxidoreductase n=1 Tax=Vogesella amnigena TaxID=1507449 RepID=A0ABV7TUA6_9NEIS